MLEEKERRESRGGVRVEKERVEKECYKRKKE